MKKLDDIPKKDIFHVPEGYFEKLPGIIQSRVTAAAPQRTWSTQWAWRYALPLILVATAIVWYQYEPTKQAVTAEAILSGVPTEALVAYLDNTNISTDELLESVTLDADDAGDIEEEVFGFGLDNDAMDMVLEEMDTNSL